MLEINLNNLDIEELLEQLTLREERFLRTHSKYNNASYRLAETLYELKKEENLAKLKHKTFKSLILARNKENPYSLGYSRCHQLVTAYRAHLQMIKMIEKAGREIHHDGFPSLSDVEILKRSESKLTKKDFKKVANDLYAGKYKRKSLVEEIKKHLHQNRIEDEQLSGDDNQNETDGDDAKKKKTSSFALKEMLRQARVRKENGTKKASSKGNTDAEEDTGIDEEAEDENYEDDDDCGSAKDLRALILSSDAIEDLLEFLDAGPSKTLKTYLKNTGEDGQDKVAELLTRINIAALAIPALLAKFGNRCKAWYGPDKMPPEMAEKGFVEASI